MNKYMPTELEIYKKNSIYKLIVKYNSDVASLKVQINNKIKYINSLNISKILKKQYINIYTSTYNSSVQTLLNKLNSDVKKINALTSIPGASTVTASTNTSPLNSSRKNALLVGINYRNTPNELSGCINDTVTIRNLLNQTFGFNNFVLLTDDTTKKPTKQNILLEFTKLLSNAVSGDSLFFLYSGHGTHTIDLNKDELDGQDELIFPIDAKTINDCISDDELNKIIQNNLKPGVKLFALFDSCFSGTVLDLKYNYLDSDNLYNVTINSNVNETSGDVIMISGCTDKQTSADAFINEGGVQTYNGMMTYSLNNVMRNNTLGSNITLKSLLEDMRRLIQNKGYTQIPQLSSGKTLDINKQINVLLT